MNPLYEPILYSADVLGLATGAWLLRRYPATQALRLTLATLLYGAAVVVLGYVLVMWLSRDGFSALHAVLHAIFFIALPLCALSGVRMLLVRESAARLLPRALGALGVLSFLLGSAAYVHARYVEPFDLEISRYEIATGKVTQPIKIVVLSDLQCEEIGAYEREVFRRIAAEGADLLLLPGDFLQARGEQYERERIKLVAEFRKLPEPRFGTFAVFGDADYSDVTLQGTGIPVLGDEARLLAAESKLALVTLSQMGSRAPLTEAHFDRLGEFDGFPIVMGHAPDYMNNVLLGHVRREMLCVAGHTHGGQVNIPGFGPPITLSRVPRWLAAGGLHQRKGAWLLVSRGVGMERSNAPRIRFNCRPQLVVVTLVPAGEVALAPR